MNLTYWLRKTPQPVAVLADDKRIDVPKNGRAWRDLTASIQAMEPSKLTCLDAQGNVIRAVVLEEEASEATASATQDQSDLQLFAKLLSEAYDKASSKMQPIVDSAMAFVERGGTRLAKAEAENDRLRAHIHKLNLQISELSNMPAPESEDSIMTTLMASAIQAGAVGAVTPLVAGKGGKK
jgi:hypothetical protein